MSVDLLKGFPLQMGCFEKFSKLWMNFMDVKEGEFVQSTYARRYSGWLLSWNYWYQTFFVQKETKTTPAKKSKMHLFPKVELCFNTLNVPFGHANLRTTTQRTKRQLNNRVKNSQAKKSYFH